MAINFYRIKKWCKMLTGKSLLHVNQDCGKVFSSSFIKGYYNNLTEKVLKDKNNINNGDYIPQFKTENGDLIFFPIAVFQYGLGCYDLYLLTDEELYLQKFFACVRWAIDNQNENGAFDCMSFIFPAHPYSAMCQGEAVSLLLRAFVHSKEKKYYQAAKNALDFMLKPLEEGGTTKYEDNKITFFEYTNSPPVMNGWIFAMFGLFDWTLVCAEERYRIVYENALQNLIDNLPLYDCGYWTKYDADKRIASPFYHRLHIAQMEALGKITGQPVFEEYMLKWKKYQKSPMKKSRAFLKKAIQKISE